MELFQIEKDQVTFSPQALLLEPFHALWERDKSKGRSVAHAEMAALYYYMDYRSDFSEMIDDQEKLELIKSVIVGMPEDWEPDELFNEACKFYQARQETPATLLLSDMRTALASVRRFLRDIDMSATDSHGKPIHDVKKIVDTLGSAHKVTEALFEVEEQVKKQIQKKQDTIRGGRAKAEFEDGI